MIRRLFFLILLSFCLSVQARDEFTIVLPTSVGTGVDASVRWLAPLLEKELNKDIVVLNLPGGDGLVGMTRFKDMPMDCNRIMASSGSIFPLLSAVNTKIGIDPMQEFEPIYGMSDAHTLLIVSAKTNVSSVNELVAYYKKSNIIKAGSLSRLTDYIINGIDKSLSIKTDTINYKNANQLAIELSENLIDYALLPQGAPWAQALLETGKIRVIAVLENKRSSEYKNIKTFEESGYKNVKSFLWTAFYVKKDSSSTCKRFLADKISSVMNSPAAKEFENRNGRPLLYLKNSSELQSRQLEEFNLFSTVLK